MKLLITGAASPRGQATLAAALEQGHSIRAVLSPTEMQPRQIASHPHLTWITVDWLDEKSHASTAALQGIEAVVHIDEVTHGPFEQHYLGTVQTTERLIQAMVRNRVRRLVLISSLAVYNYAQLAKEQLLDENSPLESALETRSPYVQAKLMQEALICSFNQCWGGQATLLRPGLNYSAEQIWQPALGLVDEPSDSSDSKDLESQDFGDGLIDTLAHCPQAVNRYWQISPQGSLPLLYTRHFASAAIAALQPIAIGQTFNLVDDYLPSRVDYGRVVAGILPRTPRAIPVPWSLIQAAERMQRHTGITLPHIPRSLDRQKLYANFKPLRYSNARAKRMLNWRPTIHWEMVLRQATMRRRHDKPAGTSFSLVS